MIIIKMAGLLKLNRKSLEFITQENAIILIVNRYENQYTA